MRTVFTVRKSGKSTFVDRYNLKLVFRSRFEIRDLKNIILFNLTFRLRKIALFYPDSKYCTYPIDSTYPILSSTTYLKIPYSTKLSAKHLHKSIHFTRTGNVLKINRTMTALSAEKKKSFAEMAAVGTSITISSMPIAVPQVEQSKPILDNGKLSFSLSDGISNSGESSNATASTDGNSTSSASTYTPSRQGFKAASVPASVSQTAAVSTAAPAKNPWKMNLVKKEPAASERPKNAPTPAESKDMNPVIAVVSSDTSVNAGATLRDKKIKDKRKFRNCIEDVFVAQVQNFIFSVNSNISNN